MAPQEGETAPLGASNVVLKRLHQGREELQTVGIYRQFGVRARGGEPDVCGLLGARDDAHHSAGLMSERRDPARWPEGVIDEASDDLILTLEAGEGFRIE